MSAKKHGKGHAHHAAPAKKKKKKKTWVNIVALIMMLAAIFAYVATLDEGDPEALPNAAGQVGGP